MYTYLKYQDIARDNLKKGIEEGIQIGIEKGIAKGREEERIEGIRTLIETCRELEIEDEIIVSKLIKKYNLSREDAEKYLK